MAFPLELLLHHVGDFFFWIILRGTQKHGLILIAGSFLGPHGPYADLLNARANDDIPVGLEHAYIVLPQGIGIPFELLTIGDSLPK